MLGSFVIKSHSLLQTSVHYPQAYLLIHSTIDYILCPPLGVYNSYENEVPVVIKLLILVG